MPFFERAALVVSVTSTGLGLVTLIAHPLWWLLTIPLVAVASLGTHWALRCHPSFLPGNGASLVQGFPPALLTLGAATFLRQVEGPWPWVALGIAAVLLAAVAMGQYYCLEPLGRIFGPARFALNLVLYLLALGYFAGIYGTRARSLQSATAIAVVAFLLALNLYSEGRQLSGRSWLAAAVSGLMLGEVTWGLNYWPMGGLVGGLFLLLVFYGLTGTLHGYLLGRLNRALLIEFASVLTGGLLLLAVSSWWIG